MNVSLARAVQHDVGDLARVMDLAFSDYIVRGAPIDRAHFEGLVYGNGVDLEQSWVVRVQGRPVALALMALRPSASRLAAMGVVPETRGHGIGARLMEAILDDARARGDASLCLEVFARNEPAVALYRRFGFRPRQRLLGFRRGPVGGETRGGSMRLEEIGVAEVARQLVRHGPIDLPWQISGESVARMDPATTRGYRLGPAFVAVSESAGEVRTVRSMVVAEDQRRQGHGTRLLRALTAFHPRTAWRVLPLCPEVPGGALLLKLGFVREALHQIHMDRSLADAST